MLLVLALAGCALGARKLSGAERQEKSLLSTFPFNADNGAAAAEPRAIQRRPSIQLPAQNTLQRRGNNRRGGGNNGVFLGNWLRAVPK